MRQKGRRRDDGAAVQAEYRRLWDLVHPPEPPAPPVPPAPARPARPVPDVAAQVRAVLAAEREAARREAEAAEAARWLMPSPCVYCGFTGESAMLEPETGKREPWTWRINWGVACAGCANDAFPYGYGGVARSDAEHRWHVARRLLGDAAAGWLMDHALPKVGFKWWAETPDAATGNRFSYVDVAELRRRLTHVPGPDYQTAGRCPVCRATDRWLHVESREESTMRDGVRVFVAMPDGWRCGCGYDDRPVRKARVSEWNQAHAGQRQGRNRPPMPALPTHPLADAVLVDTQPPED